MKRRSFINHSSLFAAFLPHCGLMAAGSQKNSTDPVFHFDKEIPGSVYILDENNLRLNVLEHSFLSNERTSYKYDEKSKLFFCPVANNRTMGVLINIAAERLHPDPHPYAGFDWFNWTKFGLVFWNPQTQKLELTGTLEKHSEIYDLNGRQLQKSWEYCNIVDIIVPEKSPYDFVVLIHDPLNAHLCFLGWNNQDRLWTQIYCDSPVADEFRIANKTRIFCFEKSLFGADHTILNIRQESVGELFFECDFDRDGALTLVPVGRLEHGQQLHQNWTFTFDRDTKHENLKNGNPPRDHYSHSFLSTDNKHLHTYFTADNKIKTIHWQKNADGILLPTVVHADSFELENDFQIVNLRSKTTKSEIPVGIEKNNGIFLLTSTKKESENSLSFQRKPLDQINSHPLVATAFSESNAQLKKPKDIRLSSTILSKVGTGAKNNDATLLQSKAAHSYDFTIYDSQVKHPSELNNKNSVQFQVTSDGNVSQGDNQSRTEVDCSIDSDLVIKEGDRCFVLHDEIDDIVDELGDFLHFDILPQRKTMVALQQSCGKILGLVISCTAYLGSVIFLVGLPVYLISKVYLFFVGKNQSCNGSEASDEEALLNNTDLAKNLGYNILYQAPPLDLDPNTNPDFLDPDVAGGILGGTSSQNPPLTKNPLAYLDEMQNLLDSKKNIAERIQNFLKLPLDVKKAVHDRMAALVAKSRNEFWECDADGGDESAFYIEAGKWNGTLATQYAQLPDGAVQPLDFTQSGLHEYIKIFFFVSAHMNWTESNPNSSTVIIYDRKIPENSFRLEISDPNGSTRSILLIPSELLDEQYCLNGNGQIVLTHENISSQQIAGHESLERITTNHRILEQGNMEKIFGLLI